MTEIPTYRKLNRKRNSEDRDKKSRLTTLLNFLSRVDLWANIAAGFLLARAVILGELLPFGVAFFAAVAARRPKLAWPVGLAVLGGTLTVTSGVPLFGVLLCLLMLGILLRALKRSDSWLMLFAVVLTGVAVIKAGMLALDNPNTYQAVAAAMDSVLIGVLTLVFSAFFKSVQRIRALADLTLEEILCLVVLSTGLINGMEGIHFWQVSLAGLLSKFAVLVAAAQTGTGGATAGVFLGFIPSLSKGTFPGLSGTLGISGLAAGLFRNLGKAGIAAGFFLTSLISTYWLAGGSDILASMVETLIAILIFLLLPASIFESINDAAEKRGNSKGKVFDFAAIRVKGLAEIFNEIAESYQHAAARDQSLAKSDVPGLMNILADRVCVNCPVVKVCWEKDFYKTYKNLLEIFTIGEMKGTIKVNDVPLELRKECGRIKEMILAVNFILDNQRASLNWAKKHSENRAMISSQLHGVSGMMNNLAQELTYKVSKKPEARAKIRRRRDFLDVGVATLSKTGSPVCGDGYASVPVGEDKHAVILSDGMGVGEIAAKESSAALSLLEQLLRTGFDGKAAVETLNSILVLRSPEETFATVDMAIFDLASNNVEFIKIGSAASYVKRGDDVEVINSSSLPVGILNNIEVDSAVKELIEGDILVMVTDGLSDVVKGSTVDWIEEYLRDTQTVNAQILAEELIVKAKSLGQGVVPDDMIALVIRKGYWG